jgi:phosphoribosylanthranilate isomerase
MFVKICGLRTIEAVEAAVAAGADALGFVFAESPRQVSPALARELCVAVPRAVKRVAVMRGPKQVAVSTVIREFAPDWLQTDSVDFELLDTSGVALALPVYRTGDVVPQQDGPVLFESTRSGQGELADWDQAAEIAQRQKLILAGGLTPDNVANAVARVQPWGVDVSSGIEQERGVKDIGLIRAFVAAARSAQ